MCSLAWYPKFTYSSFTNRQILFAAANGWSTDCLSLVEEVHHASGFCNDDMQRIKLSEHRHVSILKDVKVCLGTSWFRLLQQQYILYRSIWSQVCCCVEQCVHWYGTPILHTDRSRIVGSRLLTQFDALLQVPPSRDTPCVRFLQQWHSPDQIIRKTVDYNIKEVYLLIPVQLSSN